MYDLFILQAVENALKYLETDQLPENWNDESLVEAQHKENGEHSSCSEAESDGDENDRNIFLEKLNKFLDEKGNFHMKLYIWS